VIFHGAFGIGGKAKNTSGNTDRKNPIENTDRQNPTGNTDRKNPTGNTDRKYHRRGYSKKIENLNCSSYQERGLLFNSTSHHLFHDDTYYIIIHFAVTSDVLI
jgi:hypothetical protein